MFEILLVIGCTFIGLGITTGSILVYALIQEHKMRKKLPLQT